MHWLRISWDACGAFSPARGLLSACNVGKTPEAERLSFPRSNLLTLSPLVRLVDPARSDLTQPICNLLPYFRIGSVWFAGSNKFDALTRMSRSGVRVPSSAFLLLGPAVCPLEASEPCCTLCTTWLRGLQRAYGGT